MGHLFISYARKDRFFAELLKLKLKEYHIDSWMDTQDILSGENWAEKIDAAIEGCSALLLVVSCNSKESEYVTYEWTYAVGNHKDVIPIQIEDCDIHPKVAQMQVKNFTQDNIPWSALLSEIGDTLAKDPSWAGIAETEQNPLRPDEKSRETTAAHQIMDYLDRKGFTLVSNTRIRSGINKNYTDAFLANVIAENRHVFRRAFLKDDKGSHTKIGFKKIAPFPK